MTVPTHVRRGLRPADNYTLVSNGLIRDQRLSDRARMLAIWLLSHREDFRVDNEAMSRAMGVGRDRTRASLRELEDAGYLTRHQHRDRGQLVSMEYQITDAPTVDGKPGDGNHGPENTSPYKKTKFQEDDLKEDQEKTSSPDGDGALTLEFAQDVQDASDAEQARLDAVLTPAGVRAANEKAMDAEFDGQFWPLYPRKVGKERARLDYRRARRKGASVDDVMAGLRRFVAEKAQTEKRFIPHASTWLNAGRWTDEPDPVTNGRPRGDRPRAYQDTDYWE